MSIELIKKRIAKKKASLNTQKEIETYYSELLNIVEKENGLALKVLADVKKDLEKHDNKFAHQIRLINSLAQKIEQVKVIKGDKGDTPKKGKDYFTPQEVSEFKTAVLNLVISLLPPQITKDDIFGLVKPLIEKDKTEYGKKWQEFENRFKEIPDLKTLEKLIENIASNYVKKNQGYTGGGANFFFDLDDTPKKQSKFGNPYHGLAGKVVKVKSDEKGLEFGDSLDEVSWGNIIGDLSDQNDLQDALNLKANLTDLDSYVPYNDANQDILPIDDTVSLGSLISEKRFKHLHISGVKVESEFTSSGEAQVFGFTLSAVIGQTIGVTDQESNGVLTFGRTTSGNVGHTGSRVWLPTLNPVFYSIQKFNSITDNQHIWGLMTIGTDISDIEGIYFAKLTGEANIQARVRDGSGTQTVDTGVAVVDATMQEFLIEVSSGRAIFYINGTEVADISSNVPTEHLRWVWRIETSGAGTKTFGLDYAKIYQNRT